MHERATGNLSLHLMSFICKVIISNGDVYPGPMGKNSDLVGLFHSQVRMGQVIMIANLNGMECRQNC